MSYTERFNRLYEDLRLEVRNKIKELGVDTISTEDYVDLETSDGSARIIRVGADVVYDRYGYEYNYSTLDIEAFCELGDYIKTL